MGPIVGTTALKYAPAAAHKFQEGDVIVALNGEKDFDPLRLPDLVADAVEQQPSDPVRVTVQRGGKEETLSLAPAELGSRGTWNEEHPLGPGSPVGAPALGIAYQVEPIVTAVDEQAPAALKTLVGGRITQVNLSRSDGGQRELELAADEFQWPAVFWELQADPTKSVKLFVEKNGQTIVEEAKPYAVEGWYLPDRGFRFFEPETRMVVADGVFDAIRLGTVDTGRFIVRIYLNLRSLLTGDLSPKLLSGPIEIFKQTYTMAEAGLIWLLWFLGVISINLAVVNFLPIPVLDGGHVMFLAIEKIRGKPATERMMIIANVIGLSIIASLMLFVVLLDFSKMQWVQRLFGL
jgi:regulator of sigma E protease